MWPYLLDDQRRPKVCSAVEAKPPGGRALSRESQFNGLSHILDVETRRISVTANLNVADQLIDTR